MAQITIYSNSTKQVLIMIGHHVKLCPNKTTVSVVLHVGQSSSVLFYWICMHN